MVAFLIILVLGLASFIVWDKVLNKEEVKNESLTPTATTTQAKLNEEEIVLKEENKSYTLNNNEHKIKYVFYYNEKDKIAESDDDEYSNCYLIKLHIYVDDKLVDFSNFDGEFITAFKKEEQLSDKSDLVINDNSINKLFGKDNKEYFVFTIQHKNINFDDRIHPIIVNEQGNLLKRIDLIDCQGIKITDKKIQRNYDDVEFVIENNTLYYITIIKSNYVSADEIKVSISDNNVTEEVVGSYSFEGSGCKE